MRVLLALLLVLAVSCSSSSKPDPALEQTATKTMAELNTVEASLPDQIKSAMMQLGTDLVLAPSRAADTLTTKILPVIDNYLATIDRAVLAAEAYAKQIKLDDKTAQALDVIRKRAESFRGARKRLVELAEKAKSGASAEELSSALMNIGLMLSVGK